MNKKGRREVRVVHRDGKTGRFTRDPDVVKFQETGRKPNGNEIASAGHTILKGYKLTPFRNPDTLVQKKGINLYQLMSDREPYIKAALFQKKMSLLSVGWSIEPASNNPRDIMMAEFVSWNLKDFLESSFSYDLYEMLDALDSGFSLLEKLWTVVEVGPWKGKWAYKQFKAKPPEFFDFELDEFDNITALLMRSHDGKELSLDIEKFFHFPFNKRYENPYGRSDLRAVYRAYWLKDAAWKLRAVYMERYSGNNLMGHYPAGDTDMKNALLQIFSSWQQESGIALPEGTDIKTVELATGSVSEFERSINDLNKEILIGILGVTLTVDEGEKSGARAMGEVHERVADLFVDFMDIQLSSEINRQIVRPLVQFNFADIVTYPRFVFDSRDGVSSQDIQILKQAGIKIPEDWIRKQFKIPAVEEQEEKSTPTIFQYHIENGIITPNEVRELLGYKPRTGGDEPLEKVPQTPDSFAEAVFPELTVRAAITKLTELKVMNDYLVSRFSEQLGDIIKLQEPGEPGAPQLPDKTEVEPGRFWRPLNELEMFAEAPRVDDNLRRIEDAAIRASRPAYEEIRRSIAGYVIRKGILKMDNRSAAIRLAAGVPVNVGPLKNIIADSTLTTDMMGRADQIIEMQNQGQDFGKVQRFRDEGIDRNIIKMQEIRFEIGSINEPLDVSQVTELFSGRIPMTKTQFKKLVELKNSEAFYVAGLEQKIIERDVQPLIVQAINNGWSEEKFLFELTQQFTKYVTPEFENIGETSEKLLDVQAQTVFRNAMMTSFNSARDNFRREPELLRTFPGSFYSSIFDSRRSDICRKLDGSTFLASDPAWFPFYPQNHHRCRSWLIAINLVDFNRDKITPVPSNSDIQVPAGFFGA